MSLSVCPCTLLELHVGSPRQQPTGAISAHVMALTHKPSFGRSVSQKCKLKHKTKENDNRTELCLKIMNIHGLKETKLSTCMIRNETNRFSIKYLQVQTPLFSVKHSQTLVTIIC